MSFIERLLSIFIIQIVMLNAFPQKDSDCIYYRHRNIHHCNQTKYGKPIPQTSIEMVKTVEKIAVWRQYIWIHIYQIHCKAAGGKSVDYFA